MPGLGEVQALVAVVADKRPETHRFAGVVFAGVCLQAYFVKCQERLIGGLGKRLPEAPFDPGDVKA